MRALASLLVGISALAMGAEAAAQSRVDLIVGRAGDPFYAQMECGARRAAAETGVTFSLTGPAEWNPQQQIPILRAAIANKPDAIIIDPTDAVALQEPLKEAVAAGIKVVIVDSELGGDHGYPYVGSDGVEGGREGARQLAKLMGGKGTVLPLGVAAGISITDNRHAGFSEAIKAFPDIKVLDKQFAGDSPDKVASAIKAALAAHPDLAGIHTDATLIGEFAGATLRNLGRDDIPVVAFDASPTEVDWLKQGYLDVLLTQNPNRYGYLSVHAAKKLLGNEAVEPRQILGHMPVTRETVDTPEAQEAIYKFECD